MVQSGHVWFERIFSALSKKVIVLLCMLLVLYGIGVDRQAKASLSQPYLIAGVTTASYPSVAMDALGLVHFVWLDVQDTQNTVLYYINGQLNSDGTLTLGTLQNLSEAITGVVPVRPKPARVRLVTGDNGFVHMVFTGTNGGVFYLYNVDRGAIGKWVLEQVAGDSLALSTDLALNDDGVPFITWATGFGQEQADVVYSYRHPTLGWQAPASVLDTKGNLVNNPQIEVVGSGNASLVHILYEYIPAGETTRSIYYSTGFLNGMWSRPMDLALLVSGRGTPTSPVVTLDRSSGRLFAGFVQQGFDNSYKFHLLTTVSGNAGWSAVDSLQVEGYTWGTTSLYASDGIAYMLSEQIDMSSQQMHVYYHTHDVALGTSAAPVLISNPDDAVSTLPCITGNQPGRFMVWLKALSSNDKGSMLFRYDIAQGQLLRTPTPTLPPGITPTMGPIEVHTATPTPIPTKTPTPRPTRTPTPTPPPPPSPVPLELTTRPGYYGIQLDWNAVNAPRAAYRISRTVGEQQGWSAVGVLTDTLYFDEATALEQDTDYCYEVAALGDDEHVITTSNQQCAQAGRVEMWIPDMWAKPGEQVLVPVNIRHAQGLQLADARFQFDVDSAVVEPVAVEGNTLTHGYTWSYTDDPLIVSAHVVSDTDSADTAPPTLYGAGALFWVAFDVVGESGQQSVLTLSEESRMRITIDDAASSVPISVPLVLQSGLLTVDDTQSAMLGDMDGDGVVGAEDAALVLRNASGIYTPTVQQAYVGDANGNGKLDAADATMILSYAQNGRWPAVNAPDALDASDVHMSDAHAVVLTMGDVLATQGTTATVVVDAQQLSDWAGGTLSIAYDTALVQCIEDVTLTSATQGFALSYNDACEGLLRVALASSEEISTTGNVLALDVRIPPYAAVGDADALDLADARLHDGAGRDFAISALQRQVVRASGTLVVESSTTMVYLPLIRK